MKITLSECEANGGGLLRDIAKFDSDVLEWVQAIIAGETEYQPMIFGINITGDAEDTVMLRNPQENDEEVKKVISALKKVGKKKRRIDHNDWIEINADYFEAELFINVNTNGRKRFLEKMESKPVYHDWGE